MQKSQTGQFTSGKKIYALRVYANKNYYPYQYMNPYQYLDRLNDSIQKRGYDIRVVEVKYFQTKSKAQKGFQSYDNNRYDFQVDSEKNKVFNTDNKFLDYIFSQAVLLTKPQADDLQTFDNLIEQEKKKEEQRKLSEVDQVLGKIMKISEEGKKPKEKLDIASIEKFKNFDCNLFKDADYRIYIKAVMSEPVKTKIQGQKDSGKGFSFKWKQVQIKSYLHPLLSQQSTDRVQQLAQISSLTLGCSAPQASFIQRVSSRGGVSDNKSQNNGKFVYFDTQKVQAGAQQHNQSVLIRSFIAVNRQSSSSDTIKSFQIQTYYFDKSIIKTQVNMGQIKKIQIYNGRTQQQIVEYYFHLAYPPKYFISQLKNQVATVDEYVVSWERIQNIFFLRNKRICKNQLLRLYLFNNTILKITIDKSKLQSGFQRPIQMLDILREKFNDKISIPIIMVNERIKFQWGLKSLQSGFDYQKGFLRSLIKVQNQSKVWILKYFILIMVRYDHLYPSQVHRIIREIQQCHEDIDFYIYVFWKIATDIWGFNNKEKRFLDYLLEQVKSAKALSRTHMMKKIIRNTKLIAHVFRMNSTPSGFLYAAPIPQMKGRLLKQYDNQSQYFMRIALCDDHQGTLKNQKYITKAALKSKMLKFTILNRQYIPLGWSPSQLRAYSLWYIHETQTASSGRRINREIVLNFLGSFDQIQNPAKRAARIGQSFSASWTYDATQIKYRIQKDIISQTGFQFTDGIGKISRDLIESISLRLGLSQLTVIQIRYLGAKGILVQDQTLPINTIILRPSMIKYKCQKQTAARYLDILDSNKYKSGFLNRQIIILLKTLKINDKVFEQLQKTHIKNISQMSFKDCSVFKQMNEDLNSQINNLEPANQTILSLVRAGFELQSQPFFRGVLQTMKKNGYNQLKNKCNIRVEKSARIIGIIDQYGVLNEDEVYCAIYDPFSQKKQSQKLQIIQQNALITRNPCLDPADIRVVRCIGKQQIEARFQQNGHPFNKFKKLLNCVIFPQKGKVPLTAQISGSDLDGDNFFICWDETLVPKKQNVRIPNMIDNPKVQTQAKPVVVKKQEQMYKQMMQFFFEYINYQKLGQIDNSHLVKADRDLVNYADCIQCKKLSEIHGKAVDFPKTGYCPQVDPKLLVSQYPDFMEKQGVEQYISESILGRLYQQIKSKIQDLLTDKVYKGEQVLDIDLVNNMQINYSKEEVKQAMQNLLDYEKSLANLIKLVGIDTQYQIYSGNFSIAKQKVDQYGKTRLISTILQLKQRYFQIFFDGLAQDEDTYHQLKQQGLQKRALFSDQIKRRAILYYIVSYIYKFGDKLKFPIQGENFQRIRTQVKYFLESKARIDKQGKFCGFIWFVIPKIIINIKKIAIKQKKKDYQLSKKVKKQQNNANKQNSSDQEQNEDEGKKSQDSDEQASI